MQGVVSRACTDDETQSALLLTYPCCCSSSELASALLRVAAEPTTAGAAGAAGASGAAGAARSWMDTYPADTSAGSGMEAALRQKIASLAATDKAKEGAEEQQEQQQQEQWASGCACPSAGGPMPALAQSIPLRHRR